MRNTILELITLLRKTKAKQSIVERRRLYCAIVHLCTELIKKISVRIDKIDAKLNREFVND